MLKKIAVLSLAVIITLLAAACKANDSGGNVSAGGIHWGVPLHEFPYDEFVSIFNDVMMFPAYIPEDLRSREDVTVSGWANVDTKSGERFTGLNYTRKEDIKYYVHCGISCSSSIRIENITDRKYVINSYSGGKALRNDSIDTSKYSNITDIGELIFYWDSEPRQYGYLVYGALENDGDWYDAVIIFTYDEESFTDSDFEEMKEYGLSELIKVIESFEYIN